MLSCSAQLRYQSPSSCTRHCPSPFHPPPVSSQGSALPLVVALVPPSLVLVSFLPFLALPLALVVLSVENIAVRYGINT